MPIDTTKDIKPLVKINWTTQKDSVCFFQSAEGTLPDRYSVTITTTETSTDGSDDRLETIQNDAIPVGYEKLLSFYEKQDDPVNTRMGTAFAEDWFLSERPTIPIKVLVSIPAIIIDKELEEIPAPELLPSPSFEIYLNTFGLQKKFDGVTTLFNHYNSSIKRFIGKVQGLNMPQETTTFSTFIGTMSSLMKANGYIYSTSRSDLIVFGVDSSYKLLYAQINDGTGFKTLYKGFNKFANTPVASNQRTVNFLRNLEQMYQIYFQNENIPMQQFFNTYVLNPPSYDLSETPPNTPPKSAEVVKPIKQNNLNPFKTEIEWRNYVALSNTPEQREALQKNLDSAANFVGDKVLNKLDSISEYLEVGTTILGTNPTDYISEGMFKQLLNKIPLQSLIAGAMECMGFRGFEFLDSVKSFLNQTDSFLDNVSVLLQKQLPTISIPDDFPVVDYMRDIGAQILSSVLDAVIGVLMQLLTEILRQLLDMCKECAVANADRAARNEAMNFGEFNIAGTLLSDLAVGTVDNITSTIYNSSGAAEMAAEVMGETKQWAKNPFLLANHIDEDLGEALGYEKTKEATKQKIQERMDAAKDEFTGYVNAASSVLTPGEVGNLLLGCNVGQEATEALVLLLDAYPNLKQVLSTHTSSSLDLAVKTKVVWEDMGKLIGTNKILQGVQNVLSALPESAQCLCDEDDRAMRAKLLKNKGLSPQQIDDQITKSNDRRQTRLEEFSKLLEKGNPLQNIMPEIYCTVVYKDPSGKVVPKEATMRNPINPDQVLSRETAEILTPEVKQGLIEKDHPSHTFLMNQVLSTIYDGLTMTFSQDIDGYLPNLTKQTYTEREIPRTIVVEDNGKAKHILNPEWTKIATDPGRPETYGALPSDAAVPGRILYPYREDGDPTEKMIIENAIGGVNDDDTRYINRDTRLDWGGPIRIRDRLIAGQKKVAGQSPPTAEQEAAWEAAQRLPGLGGNLTYHGRKKPEEYVADSEKVGLDEAGKNSRLRLAEYSRMFGYSPIPIMLREKGPTKYAPGLQEAYASMCSDEKLFDIADRNSRYQVYNFQIDNNIFEASGVGNEVQKVLANIPSSPATPTPSGIPEADYTKGMELIAQAFNAMANSTYDIDYVVPYSASLDINCGQGWPMDAYAATIQLTPPTSVGGSAPQPPFIIYQHAEFKNQKDFVCQTRQNNEWSYDNSLKHIPQEQAFVTWNLKAWQWGAPTYQNSVSANGDLSFTTAETDISVGVSGIAAGNLNSLSDYLYDKRYGNPNGTLHGAYDALWRDYYCSFTRMISKSPFLELEKLATCDLIPMPKTGEDPLCSNNTSLLGTEEVKQRVRDEYGVVQCIESSFPNVDGLGTNKDNPFEKANLGGAVLLTVRTYVLEVMLRSIFVFYYFRAGRAESVDNLLVAYISQLIKKDVEAKNFMNEFRSEALDLYNRNAASLTPPREQTSDFNEVLEYLIRQQVIAVGNRLSRVVGTIGDTSLDSYLLIDQSTEDPAWIPGWNIPASPNDPNRILKNDALNDGTVGGETVPPDQIKELLGNGSLSPNTLELFNWDAPVSYLKNLPIGMLFREYFGKDSTQKTNIWSREAAISSAIVPERWRWITGVEPRSPNKSSGITNREENIFQVSGITSNNQFTPAGRNTLLGLDAPPEAPTLYSYGVSDPEKKIMSILLKMLAAGTSIQNHNTLTSPYSAGANTWAGKLLKSETKGLSGWKTWRFHYNDVWDREAWNLTGRKPADWVVAEHSHSTPYRGIKAPTDSMSVPGGSSKNRSYFSIHWYDDWNNRAAQASNNLSPFKVFNYRQYANAAYPQSTQLSFLRWIDIGGISVGPWKGFEFSSGLVGWKLINPTYAWTPNGQPKATYPQSWTNTVNRTNTPFENHTALLHGGLEVGVGTRDAAYFGLPFTAFDSDGRPVNPAPDVNPYSYRLFQRASNLLGDGMKYISLLDLDVLTIVQMLKWEKSESNSATQSTYQQWIDELEEAIQDLQTVYEKRKSVSTLLLSNLKRFGPARPVTPEGANPGKSFENGNFIKEYYLRIEEQDYQGMPQTSTSILALGRTLEGIEERLAALYGGTDDDYKIPIERTKWANSNYVDKGSRTEFMKGVVNFKTFQDYIDERFESDGSIPQNIRQHLPAACVPQPLTKALIGDVDRFAECGEAMAKDLGVNLDADRTEFVLGDFFKSIHLGVRISYVSPMIQTSEAPPPTTSNTSPTQAHTQAPTPAFSTGGGNSTGGPPASSLTWTSLVSNLTQGTPETDCWRDHSQDSTLQLFETAAASGFTNDAPFKNIAQGSSNSAKAALYQKAFFVPNGNDTWAHVAPMVCSEVEIDPLTPMSQIAQTGGLYKTPNNQGGLDDIKYFDYQFLRNYRRVLIPQLMNSPEYKSLFRYLFPVDRMLSLNQIYGSEYLRSYKGVNETFDPTKIRLKDLFITLSTAGNYEAAACGASNLGLQLGSLNGIPWEGMAQQIAIMIAKTVVLIFKGFVEAFDINIAVSKMIKDSIHLVNQLIAQGLTMANTAQSIGAAAGDLGQGLFNPGACKDDITPTSPPDAWFDPVDENFIPEPQIMYISLALLPITLLPMLWPGLPITPFGVAYWAMDWKLEPNWLNSYPPGDSLDKLLNKDTSAAGSIANSPEACNIDSGLPPPSSDT